ncbi:MAG: glycine--tRNA ligase subunit beta [Deltaproteobacteria bacterium]|nr:glycine--tRNA ligase subunit beta [Deltaproteobacteria bacterium]
MFGELLFEIGTEEIPSGYLQKALEELKRLGEAYLRDQRIGIGEGLISLGTPRRLVLVGQAISLKQEDVVQEVTGPPKSAAFDKDGKPTRAAIGFAKKHGVTLEEVDIVETPKGEYLHVKKNIPGRPAIEILSEILPRLVADLPWPKSMRWGSYGFSFVRPIHWFLALFDGEVIPFEIAGIRSGNRTRGHRFMSSHEIEVKDISDYLAKMRDNHVLVDPKERQEAVERAVSEAAKRVSGEPSKDPELLETVANLVEFPSAVCGAFDKAFLSIPEPVLTTAMKEHQKYFSLYDGKGRLLPHFVAVNNTITRDDSVVRRGHERVLRARLADADFFFREDRKRPLRSRLDDLKGVIYQAELGTSYSKVQRFARLAEYIGARVAPDRAEAIKTVALLCKCDLVTEMVTEFPSLQGVMGKEYARLEGYPEEICTAIYEHYLPAHAGDDLPSSTVGAVVGIADRIDTIAGCFAVGQEPTGTADPFAIRRHALAIVRIIESMVWDISLGEVVSKSLEILKDTVDLDKKALHAKIMAFFRERYKNMMLAEGFGSDVVEAVLSSGLDTIVHLRPKMRDLERFMKESGEFEALVLTYKRISNILKNQSSRHQIDPGLFKEPCETELWNAYLGLKDQVQESINERKYFDALNLMANLRSPVDKFFDGVEILTKETRLRENRVALLQELSRFFLSLADLSKFSI